MEMKPHHLSGMKATGSISLRFENKRETLFWVITQCDNIMFCITVNVESVKDAIVKKFASTTSESKVKGRNQSDHRKIFHRLHYFC